ncbi:hypothetical protein CICLE_v10003190mg [Citrus x clementina]|uniref:Uncharacterized protein n=1 Tax=Citrus clementina TaxID=85681 RepID=V4TAU6_CITCL|nr:hypothetical protein CICLE_v10003190mg [Citrus x clementina]
MVMAATHSTRRWNMRPAEMEELLSRRTINIRASICDVEQTKIFTKQRHIRLHQL